MKSMTAADGAACQRPGQTYQFINGLEACRGGDKFIGIVYKAGAQLR